MVLDDLSGGNVAGGFLTSLEGAERLLAMSEEEIADFYGHQLQEVSGGIRSRITPMSARFGPLTKGGMAPIVTDPPRKMLITFLRQVRGLICDKDGELKDLRDKLVTALGVGGAAAVLAATSVLLSVGFGAALSAAIAAILVKGIAQKTLEAGIAEFCEEFGKLIDKLEQQWFPAS